jgi:hypothetical protein
LYIIGSQCCAGGEDQVFVLAGTEEFEKLLVGLDADGKKKLAQKIEKTWNDVYKSAPGKIRRAPRPRVVTASEARPRGCGTRPPASLSALRSCMRGKS